MNSPYQTGLFSLEIVVDGKISSTEAREKWEQTMDSSARKAKIKGKPLFLHSRHAKQRHKYVLHYYQSYGRDFCDTMFTGEIFEYDDGKSQITGKITTSTSMKRFAAALFILAIPLAFLFNVGLYHLAPYLTFLPSLNELFTFIGAALVIISIGIMCLIIDKRKIRKITDYLHEFLQEESDDG